ncbi:MAG TPA: Lrp/AsnC ligand binding domain-containing protein [Dehalococcoidia bacterium]|nr:Lrp/AsnC ligand binding domain-containing protein [Dehalococcoidia bacterium]
MAAKAFVLIETDIGKTKEVYTALQKLRAIKSVDAVTGPYDIIITIEGDDINAIGKLVAGEIHAIPGIRRTVTCLSLQVN